VVDCGVPFREYPVRPAPAKPVVKVSKIVTGTSAMSDSLSRHSILATSN
jgi:hypothetical protein